MAVVWGVGVGELWRTVRTLIAEMTHLEEEWSNNGEESCLKTHRDSNPHSANHRAWVGSPRPLSYTTKWYIVCTLDDVLTKATYVSISDNWRDVVTHGQWMPQNAEIGRNSLIFDSRLMISAIIFLNSLSPMQISQYLLTHRIQTAFSQLASSMV